MHHCALQHKPLSLRLAYPKFPFVVVVIIIIIIIAVPSRDPPQQSGPLHSSTHTHLPQNSSIIYITELSLHPGDRPSPDRTSTPLHTASLAPILSLHDSAMAMHRGPVFMHVGPCMHARLTRWQDLHRAYAFFFWFSFRAVPESLLTTDGFFALFVKDWFVVISLRYSFYCDSG